MLSFYAYNLELSRLLPAVRIVHGRAYALEIGFAKHASNYT